MRRCAMRPRMAQLDAFARSAKVASGLAARTPVRGTDATAHDEGSTMKMLLGCLLLVVLSGCIPIGFQGRTSAIGAPASAFPRPTADARGLSV